MNERTLFDRRAKLAFVLVSITLLLGSIGFKSAVRALNVYLEKQPVELRNHFDNIRTSLGDWRAAGESRKLTEEIVEALGTDKYLNRNYVLRRKGHPFDGAQIDVHLAYYTGIIDAVPHVPDRCLVASGFNVRELPRNYSVELRRDGWTTDDGPANVATGSPYEYVLDRDPVTMRTTRIRMPIGDLALRTTEFSHRDQPRRRFYGGYFFIANGRTAASPEGVKLIAFRKSEEFAYYCKVQFFAMFREDVGPEEFLEVSSDLLESLIPEVMRCLPDWAEVEAEADAARQGA